MPTATVDLLLNMETGKAPNLSGMESGLKRIENQANRTRERMEKIVQVGNRIAMAGAAMVAPFALAMNKYLEAQKEIEKNGGVMDANARRMIALQERWAAAQERIGKVATEVLLPYLEKALDLVDKIAAFAEQHPGAVKAALGIGSAMVLIGGALSTVGTIVQTLATVQGLMAGVGAIGGAEGIGAALAAAAPAIGSAIAAAAPFLAIAAAVALAAEATRNILNWALGTNTTWADIGVTIKQLFAISAAGWQTVPQQLSTIYGGIFQNGVQIIQKLGDIFVRNLNIIGQFIVNGVGRWLDSLRNSFINAIMNSARFIANAVSSLSRIFSGLTGKATGGYVGNQVVRVGERGREFVMSNSTTRAAENIIGGSLTQQRLLQSVARGASVYQNMRFSGSIGAADKREVKNIARRAALEGIAEAFA